MDLRQLHYFVAIVEEGSITAASRRLNISQPPLSMLVTQLERELGVKLLERHPRGINATEAGEHLVMHARRLLSDAARLQDVLGAMGAGVGGELRVAAEPIGLWNVVGEHVAWFGDKRPTVTLSLIDAPAGQLLDLVREGNVDVAVIPTYDPAELAAAAGELLRTEMVKDVPLVLVAPRDLAQDLGGPPVKMEALLDLTWILPHRIPGLHILPEAMDEAFARAGRRPAKVLDVSTPHTALPLVAAGMGITVASLGVAQHLPMLTTIEVEGGLPHLQLIVVWRQSDAISPVAQRFVEELLSRRASEDRPGGDAS